MKTAMSSFDIAAIIPELKRLVIERRVDNVYQPEVNLFLLKLTPGNVSLIIEPQRRIHTTRYEVKIPQKPTSLAAEFRKHLRGKRIREVQQTDFERAIEIKIGDPPEDYRLIVELFPRGALILTDSADTILASTSYARMKDRAILRGGRYVPAPSIGTSPLQGEIPGTAAIEASKGLTIVKALTRLYSIGGQYSEEALHRTKIEKNRPTESLTQAEWKSLAEALHAIATQARESPTPTLYLNASGEVIDVTPMPLVTIGASSRQPVEGLDRAVDDYFTRSFESTSFGKRLARIETRQRELERTLASQRERREEIVRTAAAERECAEAIFAHLTVLQSAVETARELRDQGVSGDDIRVRLDSIFKETPSIRAIAFDSKKSVLTLDVAGSQIALGRADRPQDIARELFERAKKAESKLPNLDASMAQTEAKLRQIELSIESERETEGIVRKRREKSWYERFRWFTSSEGFLIVGGRDASSNEVLVKRHAEPHDLVFHAEIQGAPFFVVKTEGKEAGETTRREAAQAAVSYSKAWKIGAGAGDVYWVKPEQLSKSPPPGEYLPKGAFVVRGQRSYIRGVEVKIAVGVKVDDETFHVIGGAPTAILREAVQAAILRPGNSPPMKIAIELARSFSRGLTRKLGRTVKLSGQDLIPFLPAGKSAISE